MRLFVAIELNDSVRSALVGLRRRLQDWDQAVRWTPEGQMHLTLKFLGETPDLSVAAIGKAAGRRRRGSSGVPHDAGGLRRISAQGGRADSLGGREGADGYIGPLRRGDWYRWSRWVFRESREGFRRT